MDKMASCRKCGKIINNDYLYCPYCGTERSTPEMTIHEVSKRLKQVEEKAIEYRINQCDEKLDDIAKALDELLSKHLLSGKNQNFN